LSAELTKTHSCRLFFCPLGYIALLNFAQDESFKW